MNVRTGRCPKCEAVLMHVNVQHIDVKAARTSWVGVSYVCPHCQTILGVSIDPVALKTDTVNAVVKQLSSKSRMG